MLCKTIKQCVVGLDFNDNKVKQYEESKNLARKCKEESFFKIESLSDEGFSTDEAKIVFCKKLQEEREGEKRI